MTTSRQTLFPPMTGADREHGGALIAVLIVALALMMLVAMTGERRASAAKHSAVTREAGRLEDLRRYVNDHVDCARSLKAGALVVKGQPGPLAELPVSKRSGERFRVRARTGSCQGCLGAGLIVEVSADTRGGRSTPWMELFRQDPLVCNAYRQR